MQYYRQPKPEKMTNIMFQANRYLNIYPWEHYFCSMLSTLTSQIQFKALFKYATEGILVADNQGIIHLANPAAETLFEYNKNELTGKKVEVLIPQRFSGQHSHLREKFHKHPKARAMGSGRDLFGITKNGREFPVEISLSPFATESGNFTIAFIIDISIRKKNEQELSDQKTELEKLAQELEKRVKDRTLILEEALQQLEISRKELNDALQQEKELNEMKSRFVSMASHEIRTPLTTILSSLTLIGKYSETNNKEKQQQHIQRIKSSISNMTDLLDDVLSISRLEEGRISVMPETFPIIEFIQSVINEMIPAGINKQAIEYHHSGLAEIFFDKKILRIILFNLVNNAIKFSSPQSTVFVDTDITDKQIVLKVKDHGIGISEEDKTHLFERFFRGHNSTNIPGTGLGLNIVIRYIELLNGEITVDSEINKGSLFTIILPNNSPNAKENTAH